MTLKKIAAALAFSALASSAMAGAIHDSDMFTANSVIRNDDGSSQLTNIGFNANFFGTTHSQLYVNNNGNVTFGSALSTYTPFGLTSNPYPIIAPFFADIDTRSPVPGITQYGTGVINGRNVFGVNWINVGYYNSRADKLNSFQLILVDRSDTGAGNFDMEFNYDKIQWETGSASGGANGFGGTSAAAGYTDGGDNDFEFNGSRVPGSFLDSNPGGLVHGSLNSNIAGQYIFQVRSGTVVVPPPGDVPEPASLALAGLGLAALALRRKKNVA